MYVWIFRRGVVGRLSRGYWPSATTSYEVQSTVMSIRKQRMLAFLISSFTMWYRAVHSRSSSPVFVQADGTLPCPQETVVEFYYEPAESVPHFLSPLSSILFILALYMSSAETAVSKIIGHVFKRLEFDSRKGSIFLLAVSLLCLDQCRPNLLFS